MRREVILEEISDGRLYEANDMVKADCQDCKGCSDCCQGMGDTVILDPLDVHRLCAGLKKLPEELLGSVLELGVPRVISKALSADQGAVLEKLGAEVVYPERDMAVRLGKKLLSGQLIDYVALLHDVEIRQIQVPESLNGKTVEEIELRQKFRLNIIAIENISGTNTEVIPENVLKKDDIIVVIGKIKNINSFEESL